MSSSHPLRVALTVNFSPWSAYSGGGQRSAHNIAVELCALGHDVTVVYTKGIGERLELPSGLPYDVQFAIFPGLRSHSGAPLRPFSAAFVGRLLRKLSRERPFDIVHGNGDEAALNSGLKSFGTRCIVTPRFPSLPPPLRDGSWLLGPKRWRYALEHSRYVGLYWALRGAHFYCPTSAASAREMRRAYGLEPARCRVIPNGVAAVYHSQLRGPERGPALFFGRLSEEKGVPILIEALKRLGPEAPPLDVVGRGPLKDAFVRAKLPSPLRCFDWLPPEQIAERLSRARYAVLPSLEESFGNAVAEAMVVGTPVISTTAGSIPELVEHQVTGVLVPPGDAEALALAIGAWERDPQAAERLGLSGQSVARSRYSWSTTAVQYESVYREALAAQ